jgi:hypothetical protein
MVGRPGEEAAAPARPAAVDGRCGCRTDRPPRTERAAAGPTAAAVDDPAGPTSALAPLSYRPQPRPGVPSKFDCRFLINANPDGCVGIPHPNPGGHPEAILTSTTDKTPGQQHLWTTFWGESDRKGHSCTRQAASDFDEVLPAPTGNRTEPPCPLPPAPCGGPVLAAWWAAPGPVGGWRRRDGWGADIPSVGISAVRIPVGGMRLMEIPSIGMPRVSEIPTGGMRLPGYRPAVCTAQVRDSTTTLAASATGALS